MTSDHSTGLTIVHQNEEAVLYLTVHTEHVQRGGSGVSAHEELFEGQQHAGLQGPVVVGQERRLKPVQPKTRTGLHLDRRPRYHTQV